MKVKLIASYPELTNSNDVVLKEKMMEEIINSLEAMKPIIEHKINNIKGRNETQKIEMKTNIAEAITYLQNYAHNISPGACRSIWNTVPQYKSGGKKKTRRRKKTKRKRKFRRARR